MSIIQVTAADPNVITYAANLFASQINVEAGGVPAYGKLSVIHNAPPYHDVNINLVRYDFAFQEAANYRLEIEYAAVDPRSCYVHWYPDGKPIGTPLQNGPVLSQSTGGWGKEDAHFKWEEIAIIAAPTNIVHHLQISRSGVFPHIRTLRLSKVLA